MGSFFTVSANNLMIHSMKLVLVLAGMGKHRAPSDFELLLSRTKETFGGQILPLAVIALTGVGVTWAFNKGLQDALEQQDAAKNRFVYSCGSALCQDSVVFAPRSKTVCSDALKDPRIIVDEATHSGQNTIEIASFLGPSPGKDDPKLADALKKVDRTVAEAQRNDIRIILNLSDLVVRLSSSSDQDPIVRWENLVESTSKHINTETGVAYADDPTIMMIKLRPIKECSDEKTVSKFKLEPQVAKLAKTAFPRQLVEE